VSSGHPKVQSIKCNVINLPPISVTATQVVLHFIQTRVGLFTYIHILEEEILLLSHKVRAPNYSLEKIVPGDFHKTHTNLLVIINLATAMDETS